MLIIELWIIYGDKEKRETRRDEKIQKKEPKRQGREKRGFFSGGFITADNIRKEVINREKKLEKDWPERYKYLTGEYFKQVLAEECRKAGLPMDSFQRKNSEDPLKKSPIPLKSSPPIPKTSSAIIGWRSSLSENNLEFLGPFYVSPKTTIEPPLEPGEFRVQKQWFIFLG
ncbi:uncharacterized protein LOC117174921 [Belonocnema kinseyi]|uniref:uncharacterized protein LOC117174921 n=1 Tax=Belonocnema kinseyi TaxID=2817044 RepID=UPI00143D0956|nr:uncharacterized protein LOC117174921 [Belonocnema kinseyi]